jgi:signal peptidase II
VTPGEARDRGIQSREESASAGQPQAARMSTHAGRRGGAMMAGAAVLVVVLDQASKAWIRDVLQLGEERPLWAGVVHLSHVWNRGAAWGMLSGRRWLLIAITLGVLFFAGRMMRPLAARGAVPACGLGFIIGGALGNLIDRARSGYVTDMIDMDTSWPWLHGFPVFNIADAALTLGVGLLFLHLFFDRHEEPASDSAADA